MWNHAAAVAATMDQSGSSVSAAPFQPLFFFLFFSGLSFFAVRNVETGRTSRPDSILGPDF